MKMGLPVFGYRFCLFIEERFHAPMPVISLGSDCHPAHLLQALYLRRHSFPFDWLNTESVQGLAYVSDNIANRFSGFLGSLHRNDRGHVISGNFPMAEFMHYPDLADNPALQQVMAARARRFLDTLNKRPCFFLYNLVVDDLHSMQDAKAFLASVITFMGLTGHRHELGIYLRQDEVGNGNQEIIDGLLLELGKLPRVHTVAYVRHKEQAGIWGDKAGYVPLLRALGVPCKKGFPKIFFKLLKAD